MPLGPQVVLCGATAFLVPCALLFLSLDAVDQNEYGLVYNWFTKNIDNKVYRGGTHLIGFWNRFVVFPAAVQTIEFSDRKPGLFMSEVLQTRTKEGLALHLSISFQYLLNQAKLPELYSLTNTQYDGLFRRIARDQLLEVASQYEGPQYWLHREDIGDQMRLAVDGALKQSCASLWGLQLLIIDLPDRYEKSITMTQVQQQMILTRRNQQEAASIRADTDIMRSQFGRDVRVTQADAEANYTLQTRLATAEAVKRKLAAEADVLQYLRSKLKISATAAVKFQELTSYSDLANATFLANIGANTMLNIGGASLLQKHKSKTGKRHQVAHNSSLNKSSTNVVANQSDASDAWRRPPEAARRTPTYRTPGASEYGGSFLSLTSSGKRRLRIRSEASAAQSIVQAADAGRTSEPNMALLQKEPEVVKSLRRTMVD